MKVIDLLNKIANGEEVPEKIKIGKSEKIFEWGGRIYAYTYKREDGFSSLSTPDYLYNLNEYVEIIEEHKEEPQEHKIPDKIDQWDRKWHYTYYKKEQLNQIQDNIEQLRQKYNKIIDYLEEIK